MWPCPRSVHAQLGASAKELFVSAHNGLSCGEAHAWVQDRTRGFGGGEPLDAVCSFLRRHLAQSGEPVPERPSTAVEWVASSAADGMA
mmetsp:Transcript_70079/g.192346  ORF Transcript_70079/g.192346 Transcript_70079/m.192346 type:complete len:88 (+) Transcript_70079:3-266(+)